MNVQNADTDGDIMDIVSTKRRSEIMAAIRSESGIERLPGKMSGLYLRKHPKNVFVRPDFGNKSKKMAIFIDGCFWHGCKKHYRTPKTNRKYWKDKIKQNMKRDMIVNERLAKDGWMVIRIWECQL